MSESEKKYSTITTIETYGGKIFKSDKLYSDYEWGNELEISSEDVVADLPVKIVLGSGNTIHIRPSDILYIENKRERTNLSKDGEGDLDE